jgi:hypothetical protein
MPTFIVKAERIEYATFEVEAADAAEAERNFYTGPPVGEVVTGGWHATSVK